MSDRNSPKTIMKEEGGRKHKGQLWKVKEPEDYEWMWGSTDRFLQKLPQSSSNDDTHSQSVSSGFHSPVSRCSSGLREHGRRLAAINKHQKAQLDASNMRASKAEIGEKAMEKENTMLATRVSEVTTKYCTLGVEYAAARALIRNQRVEIAINRGITGISVAISFICLVVVLKVYHIL